MHTNTRVRKLTRRSPQGMFFAGLLLVALVSFGCQSAETDSDSPALGLTALDDPTGSFRPGPPTIEELETELNLTAEQLPLMQAALTEWQDVAGQRQEERQARRGEGRQRGERFDGQLANRQRPAMDFLVASVDILTVEQFGKLTAFLAERRTVHRTNMMDQRSGQKRHQRDSRGLRGEGHRKHGKRGGDRLMDQLNLTDRQQAALDQAHEEHRDAMQVLREECGDNPPRDGSKREKMGEFREQMDEKLQEILTDKQYQQLTELRGQRRENRIAKRETNREQKFEQHIDFLARILKLDDGQLQQVTAITPATHDKMKTLREGWGEDKPDRDEIQQQHEQIRAETDAALREVFTAEQLELYEALKVLFPDHQRQGRRGGFHSDRH